jgi:hypothetical protein
MHQILRRKKFWGWVPYTSPYVGACGKGSVNQQASPAQTCAALRVGGRRALVYIFDSSPQLQVHMSKTLTATYFYENFVPLLLLERLAYVLRPRPSIPSFPALERVTEPVPRVRLIRSHSTTMPCDVSSSFPPSPNEAEVPVCGVLHHPCVPRAKTCTRAQLRRGQ